jgi:hypothetical protein
MEKDCYKKKTDEKNKGSESASVADSDDEDAYYMDDDFFDHVSSDDDFEGPDYEEPNVLDDKKMVEPNVYDKWTVVTNNNKGSQDLSVKEESEEIYKEEDVIEALINLEGEHFYGASPTTTTYQDKAFSRHLMEACLRLHKKRKKTNKTISEEQEEDYDIAKLF